MELTQDLVKQLFDYRDGFLYWKVRQSCKTHIGEKAGYILKRKNEKPRRRVGIRDKKYNISRIIFLWNEGYLPIEVDHIDRDTLNDNINNLRAATKCENNRNKDPLLNRSSKYKGVAKHKKSWQAYINVNNSSIYLGYFVTEKEAGRAYNNAAKIYHGEFAVLNVII